MAHFSDFRFFFSTGGKIVCVVVVFLLAKKKKSEQRSFVLRSRHGGTGTGRNLAWSTICRLVSSLIEFTLARTVS